MPLRCGLLTCTYSRGSVIRGWCDKDPRPSFIAAPSYNGTRGLNSYIGALCSAVSSLKVIIESGEKQGNLQRVVRVGIP